MTPFEILKYIREDYLNIFLYRLHYYSKSTPDKHLWLIDYGVTYASNYSYLYEDPKPYIDIHKFDDIIFYHDRMFHNWLERLPEKELWPYIESHHKPTGEIFQIIGIELMESISSFEEEIKYYLTEKYNSPLYTKSAKNRILIAKDFLNKIIPYAKDLKDIVTISTSEKERLSELEKEYNAILDENLSLQKKNKGVFSTYTRYKLIEMLFPEVLNKVNSVSNYSSIINRNKLFANILGIHPDTAKNILNGTYKYTNNQDEQDELDTFLNEIKQP
jgi:hypothetical protein